MKDRSDKRERTKKIIKRTLIILLLLLIAGSGYLVYYLYNDSQSDHEYIDILVTKQSSDNDKMETPVDFDALMQMNSDIYAWIEVPNTNVNYPIVQSKTNDEFYLKHSAVDKSWIASGAIYTESCNSRDFDDSITLVYGHNGYSDIMFTTLHNFESKGFFDANEYFYIYMPGKKLTYQIVSAFKYDDRHIMNTFDFSLEEDLAEFQATVMDPPGSNMRNVRTGLETPIDSDSKIVVLSTCITGQKSNRYLVCGVLVKTDNTF